MNGINLLKIILSLIIIINLKAKDFYISFQYKVSNYKISFSRFNCSKAMTSSIEHKKFLFSLPCKSSSIRKCCYKNKSVIINELLKNGLIVTSNDEIINSNLKTRSKLTFLPHRFDIIMKNQIAYFYLKGNE